MEYTNKEIRLTDNRGTVILTAKAVTASGLSERADRFYQSIAQAFEKYVREKLISEALSAYEASTDRRKRYRYTPLNASLSCQTEDGEKVELLYKWRGEELLHEIHLWKNGLLSKRKIVKRS